MKIALVAALALAVTAAQAQQDKGAQDRGYGQEKRAGEMHGQKGVKVSNPSEWQFHKASEQHKEHAADMQATGDVECAEPFAKKTGLVAKIAKLGTGARFKCTAKEDMYIHVHEGSLSFSESAPTGAQAPGQERSFGQNPPAQPSDPERRAGQDPQRQDMGMKSAQAGAVIYIPKGTTCWISSTGETKAVVFTKWTDGATGETESEAPKTDVK